MRACGRDERGAALVEFALILPLLCALLFGIVQFGLAYDRKQSVNSAAREGARLAGLEASTFLEITDRARSTYDIAAASSEPPEVEVLDGDENSYGTRASGGGSSGVQTNMPCSETEGDEYVVVIVRSGYDFTIPFYGPAPADITGRAEFRCE
ncbi:MAG: TadE family protein [Acidimicrobiales bacterium]|nr:TadE family protein [Acidimicrobiales bacterium]